MNDKRNDQTLEDILDAFVASGAGPNSSHLADWVRRYPMYDQEVLAFAASWSLMRSLPPSIDEVAVEDETLVLRGMSIVQNLLHEHEQVQARSPGKLTPIEGLIDTGRERGLTPHQLASAATFGDALLRKLDRRLIRFASIPVEAIEALAKALDRDIGSVATYLQQPPTLASGVRYRAEQAPKLTEPEDFFTAVRTDPTMSARERQLWLAFLHERRI